jgi:L-fuconolactonase
MRIDAHQHFWKFDPVRDGWMAEDTMGAIRKDFTPPDLLPLLESHGFDGCVAVQADQSEAETTWLLDLAEQFDFIKGVVGWVDLRAANIHDRLALFSRFKKLKGFRHILQGERDRAMMLHPDFRRGINALKQADFTYDLLILPDQLEYSKQLVASFPGQRFVIDHLAKPRILNGKWKEWNDAITPLGSFENLYCKLSGLVTEHHWAQWKQEDFHPYMDTILRTFGINRVMFGSDWPVCTLAATYAEVYGIVETYFASFTRSEQDQVFGTNAVQFYNLSP